MSEVTLAVLAQLVETVSNGFGLGWWIEGGLVIGMVFKTPLVNLSISFSSTTSHNVFSTGLISMSPVVRPTRHSIVCEATPNKKADSAAKRAHQAEKRRVYNKARKSEVKTRMKKLKIDADFLYFLADAALIAFQYGNPDTLCSPLVEAKTNGQDLVDAYAKYVKDCFLGKFGVSVQTYDQKNLKNTVLNKFYVLNISSTCHRHNFSMALKEQSSDVCKGDVVLFTQKVYKKFGKRTIAGRVVKESYGAAKQQHTFTEADKEKQKRETEEMGDAMKSLENRTLDSKRDMDILAALG
ncbi:putative serine protease EDA2 [Camellia lanceoleosa]|uniref:Serine protease EDA2 n=1 Tax=Camellia lanceoleosa TaxID=1840588 RepID=A0ACC0HT04_9ERIC|nr:putative serine protease EDA2 [Camellia lanceoleosa]